MGTTIDQIVAQQLGQDTPLPSLELSIEDVALSCGSGYACAYIEHHFLEDAHHAAAHGKQSRRWCSKNCSATAATKADRRARKQLSRSLLDSVMEEAASLQRDLPRPIARGWPSIWMTYARSSAASKKPSSRLGPM